MPLYGAFSGYMSIKKKIQDLQSHLNGLYIMHNISSNNGAISQVLDEALEQEDKVSGFYEGWGSAYIVKVRFVKAFHDNCIIIFLEFQETILAYFFLWCGLTKPKTLTRTELDSSVEEYLKTLLT